MKIKLPSLLVFNEQKQKVLFILVLGVCTIFLFLPLFFHMYAGSFMRLSGDDYCYGGTQAQYGFWEGQWYAYQNIGRLYLGDRYSLNLAEAIFNLFVPKIYPVFLGAGIILWTVSLFFFLYQLTKYMGYQLHFLELFFLSASLLFFTLYVTSDLSQTLYWVSGMATYLYPLIFIDFLLGLIFWAARSFNPAIHIPLIFLTAFVGGGFSETTAVLQLGCIILIVLWAGLIGRQKKQKGLFIPAMIAFIPTCGSILLLVLSPSTQDRLTVSNHPSAIETLYLTIKFTAAFFYHVVKDSPFPYFLIALLGIFYSHIKKVIYKIANENKKSFFQIGWIGLACFFLVAASVAPSAYGQNAYPGERALFPARFVTVILLMWFGYRVGSFIPSPESIFGERSKWLVHIISLVFAFGICTYAVRATSPISAQFPKFQKWAYYWDLRDQQIRQDKQNGILNIHVMYLDHVIYDVVELTPDPSDGYNKCAERYYKVDSISADLPGWDR